MALEEMAYLANRQQLEDLSKEAKEAREEIIESSELAGFVIREQIDEYPKIFSKSIREFGALQDLQPAGYAAKPNEEFTEEEFFEEEGESEEQEPETKAAKKEK
jgi:hypothetical protein